MNFSRKSRVSLRDVKRAISKDSSSLVNSINKVFPDEGNRYSFAGSTGGRTQALDIAKIKSYFKGQVKRALSIDRERRLNDSQLEFTKSFSELGKSIYGFRWSSKSFHEENTLGDPEDRKRLLRDSLEAAVETTMDLLREEKEQADASFIAFVSILFFLAELASVITTVFLFLENMTWEGIFSLSTIILTRIFHVISVYSFQKSTCRAYLEAVVGLLNLSDAYIQYQKKDREYVRTAGEAEFQMVSALRKGGTGILQFFPQMILNLHIILRTLEKGETFGGLLWIQLISISATIVSFGATMSKFNKDITERDAEFNYHVRISHYMPTDPKKKEVQYIMSSLWIMIHGLIVCIGVASLTALTSVTLSGAVLGGFIVAVTILRSIANGGELRYYLRLEPSILNTFISYVGPVFLYSMGPAILPLPLWRFPANLGAMLFGFVWISSFGLSVGFVSFLVKNITFLLFFGCLCVLYVVIAIIFLSLCREDSWKSFFFLRDNWKSSLRNECFHNWDYGSVAWRDVTLRGDQDAHYAGLIKIYLSSDLPWDLLTPWLDRKKGDFLVDPPRWISEKWLSLIPKRIRTQIWTEDELADLKDSMMQLNHIRTISRRCGTQVSSSLRGNAPKKPTLVNIPQLDQKSKNKNTPKEETISGTPNATVISDEKAKEIRKMISLESLTLYNSIINVPQSNGLEAGSYAKTSLGDLGVPVLLETFLEQSVALSKVDLAASIALMFEEDFVKVIIESNDPHTAMHFPSMVITAIFKHVKRNQTKQKSIAGNVALAAFFELCDELSDFILAILFAVNEKDFQYAAILMFVFMGMNRSLRSLMSFILGEPTQSIIEGIIGIRCITDTYRLMNGCTVSGTIDLRISQMITLAIGLFCESFPQMLLQLILTLASLKASTGTQDFGILAAQITSVLASCIALGFSFTTIAFEYTKNNYHKRPSETKWYPYTDVFKEAILFVCSVVQSSLHVLLIALGSAALITYAPMAVSFSTILAHFLLNDRDANRGALVQYYKRSEVPWDKVELWLTQRKGFFLNSPPLWMTTRWFDSLTPEVKSAVWKAPGELQELMEKVKEVCDAATTT
eukprot:g1778.t1